MDDRALRLREGLSAEALGDAHAASLPNRRATGSHYTPRSLTEPIVARTLEPLLLAIGPQPSSQRLLRLRICDPSVGGGAFLLATCRLLAEHVVAAWAREGLLEGRADPFLEARRLVAQHCLHGVDIDLEAVLIARRALWLETREHWDDPLTYLDHGIRHGDALVGLSAGQICALDINPPPIEPPPEDDEFCEALGRGFVAERDTIRLALSSAEGLPYGEYRSLLSTCRERLERWRVVGDVLISAWFADNRPKQYLAEALRRRDVLELWWQDPDAHASQVAEFRRVISDGRTIYPFHWNLEFPAVFLRERQIFDFSNPHGTSVASG